ncbi:histidine kinase [Micromonospora sp. CPCC 205371]|nr:histidine kinase [Micromonospora sp. CPCC 205371]
MPYLLWTGLAIGWWSAYAWVNAVRAAEVLRGNGAAAEPVCLLPGELAMAMQWVPFTLLALWLAHRFPIGAGTRAILVQLAGMIVALGGRVVAVIGLNPVMGWYVGTPTFDDLLARNIQLDAFTYGLIVAAAHAVYYARAHRLRERQLARAELNALRAQLQPHFLFNTLNTIAALVPEDPEKADRMISGLGQLLRRSLDSDGRLEVPLREEIATTSSYLDIEQARFEDRLRVSWRIEPGAGDALVPPLVLQPLVENAIHHGLWPRARAGELRVTAGRRAGWLRIAIEDDGVGLPPEGPPPNGLGLANTRVRLEQLYGARHQFTVAPRDSGGVAVTVKVPYRTGRSDDAYADRG